MTCPLGGGRSIQLSYGAIATLIAKCGAGGNHAQRSLRVLAAIAVARTEGARG